MVPVNTEADAPAQSPVLDIQAPIAALPAERQLSWDDPEARFEALAFLPTNPPLVSEGEVRKLRAAQRLTRAPSWARRSRPEARDRWLHIGRIGGRPAKPRSQAEPVVGGFTLPTYGSRACKRPRTQPSRRPPKY